VRGEGGGGEWERVKGGGGEEEGKSSEGDTCIHHPLFLQLLSAVVSRNWTELTRHGNLENWREILAALVTYASPEDFAPLCGTYSCPQPTSPSGVEIFHCT